MHKTLILIIFSFPLFAQELPDEVFLKTPFQTRNNFNEFILVKGEIYQKPLGSNPLIWKKLKVPNGPKNPISIAVGGAYFQALNGDGTVYTLKSAFDTHQKNYKWTTQWGNPLGKGPGAKLPLDLLAWDFSQLSLKEDKFVLNPLSGRKDFYLGNAHLFWLHKNGRWIKFMDPWVVSDHSYEVCGPFRGRFKSNKLSSAGSLILIMNKYGDMFTRLYDFDLSGHNSVYYRYSYEPQNPNKKHAPRQLPLPGWKNQPKIKGQITDVISVFKSGQGAVNRELRVEGINKNGQTGYWYKDVKDPDWKFQVKNHKLFGKKIKNPPYSMALSTLGPPTSKRFKSTLKTYYTLELLDYHPYCSPSILVVRIGAESLKLNLHSRGTFRTKPRPRGLTDIYLEQNGVVEIPNQTFKNLEKLGPKSQVFIKRFFKNKRWTEVKIQAKKGSIWIKKRLRISWFFKAN